MSRPRSLLEVEQQLVDPDDVVHVPGERGAEDADDADRVLVEVRRHVVGADRVLVLRERDDPRLDVEVAAELLPHHVDVAAEDEVGPVRREVRGLAALLPLPLQGQRAEHDRLGRALGAAARRLARRVEQVGQHPHAALLDLGRDRVLRVVDEVAVQVLGDDPLRLRLHPGRDEGGQVALRVALHGSGPRRPAASHRPGASRSAGSDVDGAASVRNRLPKSASAADWLNGRHGVCGTTVLVGVGLSKTWMTPPTAKQSGAGERPPVDESDVDGAVESPDA